MISKIKRQSSFIASGIIHLTLIASLFIHFQPSKEQKKVPEYTNLVLMPKDIPVMSKLTRGDLESNKKNASKEKSNVKNEKKSKSEEKKDNKQDDLANTDIQQGLNKPIISDEEAIQGFKELSVLFFIRKDDKLIKEWYDENGQVHRELFTPDYKQYAGTIWVKVVFSEDGVAIPDSVEVVQKSDNMSDEAVQFWLDKVKKMDMVARYRRKFTVIFPVCIRAVLDDKIIDGKVLDLYPEKCEPLKK